MNTYEANQALGFDMDQRDYGVGAQILRELGIRKMRLMSNNPTKRVGLIGYGLEVVEAVPIEITPNPHNEKYLQAKRDLGGHKLANLSYGFNCCHWFWGGWTSFCRTSCQ